MALWLVAMYGPVGRVRIAELGAEANAPILKEYLQKVPAVRPFFRATPDAPLQAFSEEAPAHQVFRILAEPA